MTQVVCFKCATVTPVGSIIGRRDECPKCHADMHVCKNCQHYDPKAYNECREPQADRNVEKERANFCDHFVPSDGKANRGPSASDLRAAAESLFKKKN